MFLRLQSGELSVLAGELSISSWESLITPAGLSEMRSACLVHAAKALAPIMHSDEQQDDAVLFALSSVA